MILLKLLGGLPPASEIPDGGAFLISEKNEAESLLSGHIEFTILPCFAQALICNILRILRLFLPHMEENGNFFAAGDQFQVLFRDGARDNGGGDIDDHGGKDRDGHIQQR